VKYKELNHYVKKALDCIKNLDYKLFFELTEGFGNRVKDKSFKLYLQKVLEDKPETHEKIVFRKRTNGKFSFVDEEERNYFLRDFLISKLFSVIGYFLPEEAKAQFFQDIWEGCPTGKETFNLNTKGLEYLEIGLKNFQEYLKKHVWDYNKRSFLAEWASWQSIRVLDENYKIFTSFLLLQSDVIERLLVKYGELKRQGRKLEAENYLEYTRAEIERTKEILREGIEYVSSKVEELRLEEEWYEEIEEKKPVKEKIARIKKEVQEEKEISAEQILEILKEKNMTAQEIAEKLEAKKEEIAFLITKLRSEGRIELNSNFKWKLKA
jgi:DNA-binding MarR family transcriptional regulator